MILPHNLIVKHKHGVFYRAKRLEERVQYKFSFTRELVQ